MQAIYRLIHPKATASILSTHAKYLTHILEQVTAFAEARESRIITLFQNAVLIHKRVQSTLITLLLATVI